MTIDERLEFLLQSTKSLHATTALRLGQIALKSNRSDRPTSEIDGFTSKIDRITNKLNAIDSTMNELALAIVDRKRRLGRIEGAQ